MEIAPGITLHLIGGHSGGIQSIRVPTERGWVVLAGDATHLWGNIRQRNPFPGGGGCGADAEGVRYPERPGGRAGPCHPGHDPLILKRFPPLGGNAEIVRLDLPPIA